MFRVGRQKTIWLRGTAGLGVFLTLTVGVRPAFGWSLFGWGKSIPAPAASSPQPAARPAGPPAPPAEMVRGRVAPTSVRIDADPSGTPIAANNPWRLFDGDGVVGFIAGAPTRVRATLPAGTVVQGLGAYGASNATFTVFGDEAGTTPMKGLDHVSLAGLPLRWNRFEAASPTAAQSLVIEIDPPAGGQSDVRELEIWGSTPVRAPAAPGAIAEALLTGLPPSAVSVAGTPGSNEMSYPKLGPDGSTTFRVDLTEESIALSRAFLVYDLEGLPHWSAARRRINGLTVSGGAHAHRAAGGLQVEEISPSWLRAGTNEIQFLASNPNDPLGYKVRNLRMVVVPAAGDAPAYTEIRGAAGTAVRALVDGRAETGVSAKEIGDGMVVDLKFPTPSQPDSLLVATDKGDKVGTITIDPVVQGKVQHDRRVIARLQDLKSGWSRIPLDATPTDADGVRILIRGDDEHPMKGRIAEMRVTGSPRPVGPASTLKVSYPLSGECVDGEAYLIGFLQPDGNGTLAGSKLKVDGVVRSKALGPEGAFSAVVPSPPGALKAGKKWQVDVEADFSNGDVVQRTVEVEGCRPPEVARTPTGPVEDQGAPYGQVVHKGQATTLSFAGATLEIPAGAVTEDTRITVRPLGDVQVPATDDTLTNVTIGAQAYRFGPHGMKFAKPVSLTIPYDRFRFPTGMSEEDLGVFFFDEAVGKYHQVQTLKGSASAHTLTAESTHFTDFIAATIATPDHPTADSFNPNSIKDMKAPDPAAGVDIIQPPTANPDGGAHLSYPIRLPPGRLGLQPDLAVTYNSEGGNGLLGVGWDLSISSIEVDTRFGVPAYDPNNESETYSLDGDLLVMVPPTGFSPGATVPRQGTLTFQRRSEGKFDTIIRSGPGPTDQGSTGRNTPAGYSWEVINKRGVHYFYGEDFGSRGSMVGRGIYRWYLDRVQDPFGNQIIYGYSKGIPPYPLTAPSTNAVEMYPTTITYTTDSTGANAFYTVAFELNNGGISTSAGDLADRPDGFTSAKAGTLTWMRRRLANIRIYEGTQTGTSYVRRYNFVYGTGEFNKSLLQSIRVCIAEDSIIDNPGFAIEFYHHNFTYSTITGAAPGAESISFNTPAVWGSVGSDQGLSGTSSENLSGTLMVGGGPGGCELFHVAAGGSSSLDLPLPLPANIPHNNQDRTLADFVDVDGDGLPDFIGSGTNFQSGGFVDGSPQVFLNTGKASQGFASSGNSHFIPPGGILGHSSRYSVSLSAGAHELEEAAHQSYEQTWGSNHDDAMLVDIDGDGFIDQVTSGQFQLNRGQGFVQPASWSSGTIPSFMPQNVQSAQKAQFALTDPFMQWVAPYSGHVLITGAAQKTANVHPGSDGVSIDVQQDRTQLLIFGHYTTTTISDWTEILSDSTPCTPGNGTTVCGTGRTLAVQAGDRVYFRADSIDDIQDDATTWNPQISYQDTGDINCAASNTNCQPVTAAAHALAEPYNTGALDFSAAKDFRLAGRPFPLWRDSTAGNASNASVSIELSGTITKLPTSDAVTIQVLRYPNNTDPPNAPTPVQLDSVGHTSLSLDATFSGPTSFDVFTNAVPGDRLFFQVSSASPIDPSKITWTPTVQYHSYCRANNVQSSNSNDPTVLQQTLANDVPVCGPLVNCTSQATGSQCQIQGDPDPQDNPIPGSVVLQSIPPYFQIEPWQPMGLPRGFVAPSAGQVAFTGSYRGPAGSRLVAHSQNRVIFDLPSTGGSTTQVPTIAAPATATTFSVSAGESVLFDVYATVSDPTVDPASWSVALAATGFEFTDLVTGNTSPTEMVVARRNYLTTNPDLGAGHFHGWSYLEWNGADTFSDQTVINESNSVDASNFNNNQSSMPPDLRAMVEDPQGIAADPQGDPAVAGPMWRGSDVDGYIGAGVVKPSRLGRPSTDAANGGGLTFSASSNSITAVGAGFIFNAQTDSSSAATQTQLIDMNGDHYPDLVTMRICSDGNPCTPNAGVRFNHVTNPGQATETGSFDSTETVLFNLPGDLRDSSGNQVTASMGIASAIGYVSESKPPSWTSALPNLGIGYGDVSTTNELLDINGDGLPDYVTRNTSTGEITVQLNLGNGLANPISFGGQGMASVTSLPTFTGTDLLIGVGGITAAAQAAVEMNSMPLQKQDNAMNNIGAGYSYFGGNRTASVSRTTVDMIDINGDGLPDLVERTHGSQTMAIWFNTGTGFAPEVDWTMPLNWPNNINLQQQFTAGLGSNDALAFSESLGFSFSAGFPLYFETVIAGCWGFEVGAGAGQSTTGSSMRFEDIDGDGVPDQVLKLAGDSNVYVRQNPAAGSSNAGVNLLSRVDNPLDGGFQLDYQRVGHVIDSNNHVDMPNSQMVLATVVEFSHSPTEETVDTHYSYAVPTLTPGILGSEPSGFYSRADREFLGFGNITIQKDDGSWTEDVYDNMSYETRFLLKQSTISDVSKQPSVLFRRVVKNYDQRVVIAAAAGSLVRSVFPALTSEETDFYEGQTADPKAPVKTTTLTYDYDPAGNEKSFGDLGDVGMADDVHYTIGYQPITDAATGTTFPRPNLIVATDSSGNILRQRSANYGSHGEMVTLTDLMFGGKDQNGNVYQLNSDFPSWSFSYDQFGNLATAFDPTGFSLSYSYNSENNTYIKTITDGFGDTSTSDYNLSFGTLQDTTDVNGNREHIDTDNYGRIQTVFAPQDIGFSPADPALATVTYRYAIATGEGSAPFWAMAQAKDDANSGNTDKTLQTLDTVIFVDGLGRVRERKKSAFVGQAGRNLDGQVTYDVAGRVLQEGFQTFEEASNDGETTFTKFPNLPFAKTYGYDVLDRKTKIQTPNNSGPDTAPDGAKAVTTTYAYGAGALDGTQRLTKVTTDPQGKVRTDYFSPRNEILGVTQLNKLNGSATETTLTTRYTYDPLSELVQVKDANGNSTTASYDSLGKMVKLVSPDAGQTEWRHYASGLLAAKETADLRKIGKVVSYNYSLNRLTGIVYPAASENVTYTYGASNASNGQAGRIASVQDESGIETRFYDQLGNVNKMQRKMATQSTSIPNPTYTMSYNYDTLGRVLNMTYPDGEVLTYKYDAGGKVNAVQGVRNGTTTNYVTNIFYNQLEQRTAISLGNGATSNYFYYTDTKRLQALITNSGSTQIQNIGYGYDLVGNVTGVTNTLPTLPPVAPNTVIQPGFTFQTYGYDDLYQLTSASGTYRGCACGCNNQRFYTLTMQYDGLGNISRKTQNDTIVPAGGGNVGQAATTYDNTYTYSPTGGPHAPATIGNESIAYDPDGNMQQTNGTFGPARTFTWTEDDRLRTEVDSGFTNTYLYDADGNRTHKRRTSIETWYVNPFYVVKGYTTETKHIMLGDHRIASEMATLPSYANPSTAGAGTVFYFHPDHLQSTSYTTGSDGSILQHDEYFATGETWISESKNSDPRNTQPWLFNSKELDETGLYAFGARYYNPKFSIWSSPDPKLSDDMMPGEHKPGVHIPENLGLYSYSWNNPVTLQDPDGRDVIIFRGEGSTKYNQGKDHFGPAAAALRRQLVDAGLSPDRVHVVTSKGEAAGWASYAESKGRKVSASVFIGHGRQGGVMVHEPPDHGTDTSLGDLATTAKVAKGGIVLPIACYTCRGFGYNAAADIADKGVGFAGWENYSYVDEKGNYDNRMSIGSVVPEIALSPAKNGATVLDQVLGAEKRVNGDLGTAAPKQPSAHKHHQ
jgi:RHS repeat-associated protein